MRYNNRIAALLIAAVVLTAFGGQAGAHLLECRKTVNGQDVFQVPMTDEPVELHYQVEVINPLAYDASTVRGVEDPVGEALGLILPTTYFQLGIGETQIYEYSVTLDDPYEDCTALDSLDGTEDGMIINIFTASWPSGYDSCYAVVKCPPAPCVHEITIEKEAYPLETVAGGEVKFSIKVENTGNCDLTNVVVDDFIPTYMYNSEERDVFKVLEAPGAAEGDGYIRWTLGTLVPGESKVLDIRAELDEGLPEGFEVFNEACVNTDQTEEECADATVLVVVICEYDYSIDKKADRAKAFPGEEVEFTITVTNEGNCELTNLRVADYIPKFPLGDGEEYAFEVLELDPPATLGSLGIISWNIDALAPGASTDLVIKAKLHEELPAGFLVWNKACILRADQLEEEKCDWAKIYIKKECHYDVKLEKKGTPEEAVAGEMIDFGIRITNTGDCRLKNVVVDDIIPLVNGDYAFEIVEAHGAAEGDGYIRWSLGTLEPGEQKILEFKARLREDLPPGFVVENKACVRTDQTAEKCVIAKILIVVECEYKYSIIKAFEQRAANPGDEVAFAIKVTNEGNCELTNLRVDDYIPPFGYNAELKLAFTVLDSTHPEISSPSSNIISWRIDSLAAGASETIGVKVRLDLDLPPGEIVNEACILRADQLEAKECATGRLIIQKVCQYSYKITKTRGPSLAPHRHTFPGERVSFIIEVENDGNCELTDLQVEDYLPAGLEDLVYDPHPDLFGLAGEVSWIFASLKPREVKEIKISGRLADHLKAHHELVNKACIVSSNELTKPKCDTAVVVIDPYNDAEGEIGSAAFWCEQIDLALAKDSDAKFDEGELDAWLKKILDDYDWGIDDFNLQNARDLLCGAPFLLAAQYLALRFNVESNQVGKSLTLDRLCNFNPDDPDEKVDYSWTVGKVLEEAQKAMEADPPDSDDQKFWRDLIDAINNAQAPPYCE